MKLKKLSAVPIHPWIADELREQNGLNEVLLAAFDEKSPSEPKDLRPLIVLSQNQETKTAKGIVYNPDACENRPAYGLESLPTIFNISIEHLQFKPSTKVAI